MIQPKIKYPFRAVQLLILGVSIGLTPFAFCENLLKEEVPAYRQKGYEAQQSGLLDEALSYYQKAVQIDPAYGTVYNDIGVVYEMRGQAADAEEAYLRALAVDPEYGKAYYNLGLLYEGKQDLYGAGRYYLKLLQLKNQNESLWGKAGDRIDEIGKIYPELREQRIEQQVSLLAHQVSGFKKRLASDDNALFQFYAERARVLAGKRNYLGALKSYLDAKQLNPQNNSLDSAIEVTQRKLLL